MDIFSLLSYINKVSLLAFFVTTLAVGYQVYVLKKEKTKEHTPFIPDFKDTDKPNEVLSYTRLPDFLIKKNNESVNYSKLIFFIFSLLTIMIVIFILILIKRNNSMRNEASINPTIIISPTAILKPKTVLSPSSTMALSPSPTCKGQACLTSTKAPIVRPTVVLSPTPTEIILAKTPSLTPSISITDISPTQKITNGIPQILPETGIFGKSLLIIGVAISTIFFSFWL